MYSYIINTQLKTQNTLISKLDKEEQGNQQ